MRDVSDKCCRGIENTHLMFSNLFPQSCDIYEIMWKNMDQPDWPQMAI
jgi:hypothetical protein